MTSGDATSREPASALYSGIVHHRRFGTPAHALRYRMTMALLDLDELDHLDTKLRLFSRNRANLFSFHDRDHLPADAAPGATLRGLAEAHLAAAGIAPDGGAIRLLSLPRILGYAFNPLSVYFCHRRDGALAAILYEVRNTFHQSHTYVIPVESADPLLPSREKVPAQPADEGASPDTPRSPAARFFRRRPLIRPSGTFSREGRRRIAPGVGDEQHPISQGCDKVFYVSPFLDMDMRYAFRVEPPGARVAVAVDGLRQERRIIAASFAGARVPLTDAALLRSFLAHPLLSFAVVAGIHWEAAKLWLKGARLHARPAPPERAATIVPRREV